MAVEIEFYKKKHYQGFENREETIKFTLLRITYLMPLIRNFRLEHGNIK
jgi:hypothetical protein